MSQDLNDRNDAEIDIDSTAEDCMALAGELATVFDKMKTHASPSFIPATAVRRQRGQRLAGGGLV